MWDKKTNAPKKINHQLLTIINHRLVVVNHQTCEDSKFKSTLGN